MWLAGLAPAAPSLGGYVRQMFRFPGSAPAAIRQRTDPEGRHLFRDVSPHSRR